MSRQTPRQPASAARLYPDSSTNPIRRAIASRQAVNLGSVDRRYNPIDPEGTDTTVRRLILTTLLCAGCVTYTAAGRHVRIENAFYTARYTFQPDPFAGLCTLVRSDETVAYGRRMFDPVGASNYAATIGSNSIYWLENGADQIKGKLEKCGMVRNMNYGQFGLAAAELECRSESGITYRIPQYRATLRFYSCAEDRVPKP
jgi:hypothetical protein